MTLLEELALRADAAASVKAGMSITDASRMYQLSKYMVEKGCMETGVLPPKRKNTLLPIIAALQTSLDSLTVIAGRMGVSRQWVEAVLKMAREAGIQFPRREKNDGR